jgi:hypothetical protein
MAVLATLIVATGCATTTSRGAQRQARAAEPAQTVRVVVDNQNWLDMNVYVQTESGARIRVGSVATGQTGVFTVRNTMIVLAGAFRIIGDPVGSPVTSQTPLLYVQPGGTAYWRIGNAESTSFYQIR